MPKVRIVADYCSPGYQLADGDARASGELPVSAELLDRLARWNDGYERCDPRDYEDVCGKSFDFVAFRRGSGDRHRLQARPAWLDGALLGRGARLVSRPQPRSYDPARSEYEMTLKEALAAVR